MEREEIRKDELIGMYKKIDLDDNGNVISETEWVQNKIVDSYAFIFTQLFLDKDLVTSKVPFMAIGNNGTEAQNSDTKLVNEMYRVPCTVAKATFENGQGLFKSTDGSQINAVDITGIFEKGIELNIKEIGIFWGVGASSSLNSGYLLSRKALSGGWQKITDVRSLFIYRILFRSV